MLSFREKSQLSPQRSRSIKLRIPNQKLLPSDFFRRSTSQSPPKQRHKNNPSESPLKTNKNKVQDLQQGTKNYWDSMCEQIQQNSPGDSSKQNPRMQRYSTQGEKRRKKKNQQGVQKMKFGQSMRKILAKENVKEQIWQQGLFTFSGNNNNKLFQIHLPPIK